MRRLAEFIRALVAFTILSALVVAFCLFSSLAVVGNGLLVLSIPFYSLDIDWPPESMPLILWLLVALGGAIALVRVEGLREGAKMLITLDAIARSSDPTVTPKDGATPPSWKATGALVLGCYSVAVLASAPLSLQHNALATVTYLDEDNTRPYVGNEADLYIDRDFRQVWATPSSWDGRWLGYTESWNVMFNGAYCLSPEDRPLPEPVSALHVGKLLHVRSPKPSLFVGSQVALTCSKRLMGKLYAPNLVWTCEWWCDRVE